MPRRVLGYARVSSKEQALGTSLQDQQDALAAYATRQGLRVSRFYVEAVSGIREKVEKRLQMQALMRDVRAGDLVLVDKVDRWSRDPEFTYRSVREILAAGASWYAVGEGIDAATPDGDSALSFRILFAREELKRIKSRLVGTRELHRDKGFWVEGVVPFGYRRPDVGPRNILLVSEEEAEVVRRVFKLAIQGRSLGEIVKLVGLKLDRVKDMLDRRFYTGEMTNSAGEWITGRHPAILDAATFQRARDAVASRRWRPTFTGPAITSSWFLRDVAVCGACGSVMSAVYGGRFSPSRKYYYRCRKNCRGKFVRQDVVEAQAEPLILARLQELRRELGKPGRTKAVDLTGARTALERKRARIVDAMVDGLITREEAGTRTQKLDEERMRLDAMEKPASPQRRRETLREVATLEGAWRRADGAQRRKLVRELVVEARMLPGAPPSFVWREEKDLVAEE